MNKLAVKDKMKISVIIPAYNESKSLPIIISKIAKILSEYKFEIIIINDGSSDNTIQIINELKTQYSQLFCISLSRNFGHQNALRAGIDHAKGDCIISIDADLQHPVEIIPKMISKWKDEGFSIVLTKRIEKEHVTIIKKFTSWCFYKVINFLSETHIHMGAADFRLIDKKVAIYIKNSHEKEIFFRGYVPWMGFKTDLIEYEVDERLWGESKYTIKKMVSLAINGITSFSIKPLRLATLFGFLISIIAFIYSIYVLYISIFTERAIAGWASVLLSVLFIGGIQLIFLGIFGEYLGKIFLQTKNRPDYIIEYIDPSLK